MKKVYDVLILGGGVAGMSAAVYAKRAGKSVLVVEKLSLGGQVNLLPNIENFPSEEKIDGFSLAQKFVKQIKALEVEVVFDDIESCDLLKKEKSLKGKKGEYFGKSVVLATGLASLGLGLKEEQFLGRGVSYCAVCDGNFFKNKSVCVASKGGSGILEALELSKVCKGVTVLDSQDMTTYARANKNNKIKVISNAEITEILADNVVNGLKITTPKGQQNLKTDGLFVALGKIPATKLFERQIKLDEKGYIITDENMQTSADGVFAVGDVRAGVIKQIVTACADGAIAGQRA